MRDNMLVNFTGLEGHFMPIDLNIEHLIWFQKVRTTINTMVIYLIRHLALLHSKGCLCELGSTRRHLSNTRPSSARSQASWLLPWNHISRHHSYHSQHIYFHSQDLTEGQRTLSTCEHTDTTKHRWNKTCY